MAEMKLCKNCIYFKRNGNLKDFGTPYYNSIFKVEMGNCEIDTKLKNGLNDCHNEKYKAIP